MVVVIATQLRGLVAAIWLAAAVDFGLGMRAVVQVLTRALTVELAILVIAALVLFAAGGAKRNLGRAFDLACVAALPLFVVALAATAIVRGAELAHVHVPGALGFVFAGVSYAWAGALVALALRPARSKITVTGAARIPRTRAGWGFAALAAAGLATQVAWLAGHMEEVRPMLEGDRAPDFALPRIAKDGALGPPLRLADTRGKIVVLDFWATWCGPCIKAMPKLETLHRRYAGQLEVIAINLDDFAKARAMFDQGGYRMTLLADDGSVSSRYGVSTIPHSVIIDRAGMVTSVYRGGSSKLVADVEEEIRK